MDAVISTGDAAGVWEATLLAINYHSGVDKTDWQAGRMDCVRKGGTLFSSLGEPLTRDGADDLTPTLSSSTTIYPGQFSYPPGNISRTSTSSATKIGTATTAASL